MSALGSRAVAQAPEPSPEVGAGNNRLQIFTYFTKATVPGQQPAILYNGDRLWTRLTLTLETAGPVAIGQSSQINPVLSGKGELLATGVPTPITLAKGNMIYIASTSVNRVKVQIEPLPWLEQITATLRQLVSRIAG